MTIASRNRFIALAAFCALVLALLSAVCLFILLAHRSLPTNPPGIRPVPALDAFPLTRYSATASALAIAFFPLFSLACLSYILFAFEKTQSIEITMFAVCAFSLSIESVRILIPLYQNWMSTGLLTVAVSRAVYFCRILTLLGILASGIFATGHTIQQIGPSIFLLAFVSYSLANAFPLNYLEIDSTLLVTPGYADTVRIFMTLIGALGALSYLVTGITRGQREYAISAGGIVMWLAGYAILAACDTWIFLIAGVTLLAAGVWIYLDRMHRYYLWQ